MKDTLLTDRQMEVLRMRKQGLTQQVIAEKLGTSKANICIIEKSAHENIRRAKEALEFVHTLDAPLLCTLEKGNDLMDTPRQIYAEAAPSGIKVRYDSLSLINRITSQVPEKVKGRRILDNISVYLNKDGEIYFG